jgi:hypothetical protein
MSDQNDDVDDVVDDIFAQLKQSNPVNAPVVRKSESSDEINTPETSIDSNTEYDIEYQKKLEKYTLDATRRLLENVIDTVETMSSVVQSAPTPEDVSAYSSAVNSANSVVSNLMKLLDSNKKAKNQLKIKKMDLDAKREITDIKVQAGMTMTRKEALALLLDEAKILTAETTVLSS